MRLLDHPIISQRYFFPRPDTLQKVHEVKCDGAVLRCIHAPLKGAEKTLVHFHGNGETAADYFPDHVQLFHRLGLSVFLREYRGYGTSTDRPKMAKMLEDTEWIFKSLGLPASELLVFGRSVGSIYAIEFARRYPDIAGLIIESGIADPLQRVLLRASPAELGCSFEALQAEAMELFNHKAVMEQHRKPLLILHAKGDDLVRPDHAVRLHDWCGSTEKSLILFPYGDHNSIFGANFKAYIQALSQFISGLQSN